MDIKVLSVFNAMNNIGLSEQELQEIENEANDTEKTGISIQAVTKDKMIIVNHDDKHNIEIQEKKEYPVKSRILMKTLIILKDIPQEIYTLHTIARYHSEDLEVKFRAENLEELKDRIIERFCDKYPKILADEVWYREFRGWDSDEREKEKIKKQEIVEKQLKAILWLFGEDYSNFKLDDTRKNISKIIRVFERNNKRLAIIQETSQFKKGGFMGYRETCEGLKIKIQAFKPSKNVFYDYCDVGREIYKQIWICDELAGKITEKELELIMARQGENNLFLDMEYYENIKNSLRVEMMTAKRNQQEQQAQEKQKESIIKQLEQKGEIIRNGIKITPSSISYEDFRISGDEVTEFIDYENLPIKENLDFNNIYADFLGNLLEQQAVYSRDKSYREICNLKEKKCFNFNNFEVAVEKIKNNFYINNYKIRQDEVYKVLFSLLKYKTKEEYSNFLKDVSKESLRVKNALKNGISFCFDLEKGKEIYFTIPVEKIKNKLYAVINNTKYPIKDSNSLFELQKEVGVLSKYDNSRLNRAINLIFKALSGITPVEIGNLIKTAEQENKKRLAKSKEFIDYAVKISNAERLQEGWWLTGKSGKEYLVCDDLKVYECKDKKAKRYICIVDYINAKDEVQRNDYIAKRIIALSNDINVAKEIFTLELNPVVAV